MEIYKKYILCVVILLIMVTATSPILFEAGDQDNEQNQEQEQEQEHRFKDVSESDWFADSVYRVCATGLMTGTSEDTFNPQDGMTRAMFVQALYVMAGQPDEGHMYRIPFTDISSEDECYQAVSWMYRRHIISESTDKRFRPNSAVTGEQAAQLVYRYSKEPDAGSGILSGFADRGSVDPSALQACAWAVKEGIINGIPENGQMYLKPQKKMTRGEAASFLMDFYRYSVQSEMVKKVLYPQESAVRKSEIPNGVKIPALMYHEVSDEIRGSLDYLFVSPDSMRNQLKWLKENGYETIVFQDMNHLSRYRKPIMLTFDDGYIGNYTNLFPLLKEFQMKATIFVVTDEIGEPYRLTEEQLQEMTASGLVSIQSHTKSHQKLDTLTDLQLIEQCREARLEIRRITGIAPCAISYPEGRYHSRAIAIVSDYYDFGLLDSHGPWYTGQRTMYYIPRTVIPRSFTLNEFIAAVRR